MAKISLICEQCGGNIILDNSHEIGTCEHCYSQYVIKQDQIIQRITQNITKNVYGYEGKDVKELLIDGYRLIELGDDRKANIKFKKAIDIEPECWSAWLGYASTGGDRIGYLSIVPAYRKAYNVACEEKQEMDTFIDMTRFLPDYNLRSSFIRAYNLSLRKDRHKIFCLVSGVIGCDESEIAKLAVDLCPYDWRAHFAMAKFRQVRARWCKLEGGLFKRLPQPATEVLDIFMQTYRLAKQENKDAESVILTYINEMETDKSYSILARELKKQIRKES